MLRNKVVFTDHNSELGLNSSCEYVAMRTITCMHYFVYYFAIFHLPNVARIHAQYVHKDVIRRGMCDLPALQPQYGYIYGMVYTRLTLIFSSMYNLVLVIPASQQRRIPFISSLNYSRAECS